MTTRELGARSGMTPRPLIFLHMPKAGGTTLEGIVKRQYPGGRFFRFTGMAENVAAFCALPESERAAFDVLSGHEYFGIHEHVRSPCTYITMLRHPVDRIVSLYHYVRRTPDHYLYNFGFADRRDVEDFVRRPITPEIDNWQTRLLNPRPERFLPVGGVDEAMLERAMANLAEHFAVVGVTERFDDTLELLRMRFGWTDLSYERRNATPGRSSVDELPASAVGAILEANRFDAQLHGFAAELLEAGFLPNDDCD
ncbi:MAG: sulfotransferase family 2 domain-containing protein [Planctomycetes bacterium]|nr:sulfotransferase family 2 domain-containing protein [Planctomycetota bacterium]